MEVLQFSIFIWSFCFIYITIARKSLTQTEDLSLFLERQKAQLSLLSMFTWLYWGGACLLIIYFENDVFLQFLVFCFLAFLFPWFSPHFHIYARALLVFVVSQQSWFWLFSFINFRGGTLQRQARACFCFCVFVFWLLSSFSAGCSCLLLLVFCLLVCLECQLIRFVISTFMPIFFIEFSFILLSPPPPRQECRVAMMMKDIGQPSSSIWRFQRYPPSSPVTMFFGLGIWTVWGLWRTKQTRIFGSFCDKAASLFSTLAINIVYDSHKCWADSFCNNIKCLTVFSAKLTDLNCLSTLMQLHMLVVCIVT